MQEVLSMDFFGEDGEVAYEARWSETRWRFYYWWQLVHNVSGVDGDVLIVCLYSLFNALWKYCTDFRKYYGTGGTDASSSTYSCGHVSSEGIRRKGRATGDFMQIDLQIEQLKCDLLYLQAMGTGRPNHHSACRDDFSFQRQRACHHSLYRYLTVFVWWWVFSPRPLRRRRLQYHHISDHLQNTRTPHGSRPIREKGEQPQKWAATPVQQMPLSVLHPASCRMIGCAHRENPYALCHHLPYLGHRKRNIPRNIFLQILQLPLS